MTADQPQPLTELLDAVGAMLRDRSVVAWSAKSKKGARSTWPGLPTAERLRAAAAAVKAEQALIAKAHMNPMAAIIGWLDQHGMELTDSERSEFTGQLAYHLEQAARAALAPLRECGVTPAQLERHASWLENDLGELVSGKPFRALATALRKALDRPNLTHSERAAR